MRLLGVVPAQEDNIQSAAEALRAGELVGLPTETVYGLAADARNPVAVRRIFAAKGRPADHPLIVHLPALDQLSQWAAAVPVEAVALGRAFWPGPLTLILKRQPHVPDEVTGGQDTVGVRVPAHPAALALLAAFGSGLAAPSANRFGRISPTTAAHVAEELGDAVAMVIDGGACEVGIESTILDLSRLDTCGPVILRPGAISADAIAAVIGQRPLGRAESEGAGGAQAPRVAGALAAHYAPRTPMRLVEPAALADEAGRQLAAGVRTGVLARAGASFPRGVTVRMAPADVEGYAHALYANLRDLDAAELDLILVEAVPLETAWDAVRDRLGRAAVGAGLEQDET